jgi:GNAT superfamily N-acetyltransferase
LISAGMQERWGGAYDPAFNPDLADLGASYVDRGADVVVAELDGRLVGTGLLLPDGERVGRLLRMSVAPDRRRRGIASAVVGELVARARRRTMTRVVVRTDTPWPDAIALYRSCGFVVVAQDAVETDLALDLVAGPGIER